MTKDELRVQADQYAAFLQSPIGEQYMFELNKRINAIEVEILDSDEDSDKTKKAERKALMWARDIPKNTIEEYERLEDTNN